MHILAQVSPNFQQPVAPMSSTTALLILLAIYAFTSLCLQKIAQKTNTESAWVAWIPVVNLFLMLKVADKPLWWFILLVIPVVNLIVFIVVFVGICRARDKSPAWVISQFLPVLNFVGLGYLAFSE